jgi:5-formyltetrahydrofolate cyclo-ligase
LADFEPAWHDVPMQAVITEDRVVERIPDGSGTHPR